MEAIRLWLKNPKEYMLGVQLYKIYGNNEFLKKMFCNETAYNKKRLVDELLAILTQSQKESRSEPRLEPLKAGYVAKKQAARPSDMEDAPAAIKRLIEQRKELYNISRDKFALMKQTKDQKYRKELAKSILLAFYEINKIWKITDYYDQKGEVLKERQQQEENLNELNTIELNQKFLNLYKYVNKYLHDERKSDNVQERIKQMHEIKKILGDMGAFVHQKLSIPTL